MTETTRSALIFGARNLGRAIIETLVAQGWKAYGPNNRITEAEPRATGVGSVISFRSTSSAYGAKNSR